ncbi:unnamed protein product [Rangifer tarandus platyrhynchus]|uniref:Uncharacterized protein n=2 Tax=Rangifer tarandus platyrhynchus TaxID=3082113 RepID=A0ACB0F5L1_RANTA|nr:unnamed protein product [Rangifer tarandus platyrhynchus]CAI9707934.1 unnamed protein product [Rangifer tarandus platyrhynchus]
MTSPRLTSPVTPLMNLPWVTLGQVSKTLLTNRTHLTHEQIEATRWLFCQFDRREERHPLPLKLQGRKVVGHTVLDAQGNPGTRAGPVSILRGPAVSRGGSRDSAELSQAPRHASISFPSLPQQTPENSATAQGKWVPTFRRGKSGCWAALVPPGGLDKNSFSLPATPVLLPPKALGHRLRLYKVPSC